MRDDYNKLWYDCSHYEDYIEWEKVIAQDVIIKAGGGLKEDPRFFTHALGAHASHKRIHLFYWVDPLKDAIEQATHFLSIRAKLNYWGIPIYSLMPDIEQWWKDWDLWEKYRETDQEYFIPVLTEEAINTSGRIFTEYIATYSKLPIVVYTGMWFINGYCKSMLTWLPKYGVWLSQYLSSGNRIQIAWSTAALTQPAEAYVPYHTGLPRECIVLWQWTGDKYLLPGCYSIYPTRLAASDLSCYRGVAPVNEFFNYGGVTMSPALFYPFDVGFPLSQKFGVAPQNYQTTGGHNGLDWAIPVGHNIYAAQDGTVTTAIETTTGYGRHIRIQSSDGLTIYGHLSKMMVKVGDIVKAKQIIGLSGGALTDPYHGYSTGPHLHFEYRPNIKPTSGAPGTLGGAVDPSMYLIVDESTTGILFKIQCLVASLKIHSTPELNRTDNIVGGLGYNETRGVYEEKNGCYRISNTDSLWVTANALYVKKLSVVPTPTPSPSPVSSVVMFTVKCISTALTVRSTPDITVTNNIIGYLRQNDVCNVYEERNGCYRISPDKQKWVSSSPKYIVRITEPTPAPIPAPVPVPQPEPQPVPIPTPTVTPIPIFQWASEVHAYLSKYGYTGAPPKSSL